MQGQVIAGFELQDHLGEGGAGHVWKARQISLERTVAIKILTDQLANNPGDIEQFKLEARAAAQLKHTGIVQVYDFGEDEGVYFFAMEYIKGYSVGDWLERKGKLSESDTLMVAQSIAEALGYAWDKTQLIHRDIKPDNVLVDEDGTIKVVDLGLVKVLNADGQDSFESENMCTPNYCSPQQANGDSLDFRTDIYSLGCMIYHMLTGELPFGDLDPHDVLDKQVDAQLPDPRTFTPDLSMGTVLLLQKMLAKDSGARPANWEEVNRDLGRCINGEMPEVTLPPEAPSTLAFDSNLNAVQSTPASERVLKVDRDRLQSRDTHTRATPAPPPKKSGAPAAIASIVIAIALIGGGLFGLQFIQNIKEQQALKKREQELSSQFNEARSFFNENSESFEEAIAKFTDIKNRAAGTEFADRSDSEIESIIRKRSQEIKAVMRGLDLTARKKVKDEDYIAAMNTYKHYTGPFAKETKDERDQKASGLEPRAIKQAEERRMELINQAEPEVNTPPDPPNVVQDPPPVISPRLPPELRPYKEAFETAVKEADASYLTEFRKVFSGYKDKLNKVKTEGQANGILDIVTAVEVEEARLSAEGTLPRRLRDGAPASVKVVMARAAQHRARLEATRNGRLDPIKTSYLNQLRAIQGKLTAVDRINDARQVKEIADELEVKSIPLPKMDTTSPENQ